MTELTNPVQPARPLVHEAPAVDPKTGRRAVVSGTFGKFIA